MRALANIVLCFVPDRGVWFTTMERGHYGVEATNGSSSLAEGVVERLIPLAESKLVIENEFRTDLEEELWEGDEITETIREAGVRMGDLDLLPAPFPIEQLLDEQDLRHVKRLYGIGGLSYGNLSARKDDTRFWMSASGVDKTKLDIPGRDILLVSGYDPVRQQDDSERAAERRAEAGVGGRDRALDDLPGPSGRGGDSPRARLGRGDPGHRRELPLRDGRAGDERRRSPGAASRTRPMR